MTATLRADPAHRRGHHSADPLVRSAHGECASRQSLTHTVPRLRAIYERWSRWRCALQDLIADDAEPPRVDNDASVYAHSVDGGFTGFDPQDIAGSVAQGFEWMDIAPAHGQFTHMFIDYVPDGPGSDTGVLHIMSDWCVGQGMCAWLA